MPKKKKRGGNGNGRSNRSRLSTSSTKKAAVPQKLKMKQAETKSVVVKSETPELRVAQKQALEASAVPDGAKASVETSVDAGTESTHDDQQLRVEHKESDVSSLDENDAKKAAVPQKLKMKQAETKSVVVKSETPELRVAQKQALEASAVPDEAMVSVETSADAGTESTHDEQQLRVEHKESDVSSPDENDAKKELEKSELIKLFDQYEQIEAALAAMPAAFAHYAKQFSDLDEAALKEQPPYAAMLQLQASFQTEKQRLHEAIQAADPPETVATALGWDTPKAYEGFLLYTVGKAKKGRVANKMLTLFGGLGSGLKDIARVAARKLQGPI